jgi:hypothetical protein
VADHIDVFIGSTKDDLKEYRQAVIDAVLGLDLHPIGMEHWSAEDAQAVEVCKREVLKAEIYIGIYAHRYGWQPDGYDGKSITELEYDWAGEHNIPRFCFIVDPTHAWPPPFIENDKKAELNAFKARVQDEVIVNYFTTIDDLARQVTATLASHFGKSGGSIALKPYLNWLHSEAKKSGLLHVMDASTVDPSRKGQQVTVDEVYTPLDTRSTVYLDDQGQIIRDQKLISQLHDRQEKLKSRPFSAMEAANFNERFVLLGDPGSGKSTFVNFLALCLAGTVVEAENGWLGHLTKQGWEHGALLPVRVVLRKFAEGLPADIPGTARQLGDFIAAEVTEHGCKNTAPLQQAFEQGEVLLLLDGLDEVPNDKRAAVRDAITDFMSAHPAIRVIVTCRILSYANDAWQIPGLQAETLTPFNWEQIEQFVGAWYNASQATGLIEPKLAKTRIRDLKQALRDHQLEGPASNPMLLTVMALVHNHTGSLPRENARLYAECVELLMFRWKPLDSGWLKDELNAREDDIYRALWELAYAAHEEQADKTGPADITESTVIGVMRKRFDDIKKAETFCSYVEERAGLLVGRGEGRDGWKVFTFPHRTFQEYLAGCHIANGKRSLRRRFKEKALAGPGWRETLLLAAGHLVFNDTDIESTIDAVAPLIDIEPADDDHWRAFWLAGDVFNLIGGERVAVDEEGRKLLPQARRQLVALIDSRALSPVERAAAGETLGRLGDPRPGVGLDENGLPDIAWCQIPGGKVTLEDSAGTFEVKPFHIAQYPVTYAQYQTFVKADDGFHNPQWWEDLAANNDHKRRPGQQQWPIPNHPAETVSWYDAMAFCRWLSAQLGYEVRLPTEMEWQQAATGGNPVNTYPWGPEYISGYANIDETDRRGWGEKVGPHFLNQTTAVGLYPQGASEQGVLDLSGNVWEWCLNTYDDPQNTDPGGTDTRVLRGGAFNNNVDGARCAVSLVVYRSETSVS